MKLEEQTFRTPCEVRTGQTHLLKACDSVKHDLSVSLSNRGFP